MSPVILMGDFLINTISYVIGGLNKESPCK